MYKLKEFINKIQTEKKIQTLNEEATKQSIILPILQLLGWQVFDTDEVYPEFSIVNTRVDYALRNGTINKVFIEVKRINEDLEKHQEQLLTYSFRQGVNLSILTNGILWWFYLPLQEGSWDQRKFYTIDMYSQETESIVDILNKFLEKSKVFDGRALENAKGLYGNRKKKSIIKNNIPKAWRKLLIEGDELLIELVSETTESICGYRPENNEISDFLNKIVTYSELPIISTKSNTNKRVRKGALNTRDKIVGDVNYSLNENFAYKKINGFNFLNQNISANSWRQLFIKFIEKINEENNVDFSKITLVTGKKRPYFTINKNELRVPKKINNTKYFAETNLSANSIVSIIKDVLVNFNYHLEDLSINIRD